MSKVMEAAKEVRRIADALHSIEITEEATAIADSIPDRDWALLVDDTPQNEILGRTIVLLLQTEKLQKRDELVRELVEALSMAKARVGELQMLMDEAFEAFGVTYGLCLRDYDPAAIDAVLAKAKAIDAGEETRS